MTFPSTVARLAAATVGVGVALVAFSCGTQGTDPSGDTGSSAGGGGSASTASGGGAQPVTGGAQTVGVATSGPSGSVTSGGVTSGPSGGVTSAGVTSGGVTSGSAAASGTGAGGASGGCTDLPPNNGDTCAHAVEYGWCSQSWLGTSCEKSCGKCSGGASGASSTTGSSGNTSSSTGGSTGSGGTCSNLPPPVQGGSAGWASRYWDCCKPACGWSGNVKSGSAMASCDKQDQKLGSFDTKNACEGGGSAFMCWSGVPWSVCDKLSYGFAAASGSNYACGRCFQLQFDGGGHSGNNPGASSLSGKTMIVQVINNGGVQSNQFDLLIPGGGVGALNACSTQWGSGVDLGTQYGGLGAECKNDKNCIQQKCQAAFGDKPDLLAGCNWYLNWFNAADNPTFTTKQVACPAAITQKSGLSDPG